MDVGTALADARRRRGRTLDEVARSTKVPRRLLDDIEHNRFDRLPGGILTKGHLRAYAAEVGVDPEFVVRQYVAECAAAYVDLPMARPEPVESESHHGRTLLIEIVVLALALLFYERYSPFAPRDESTAATPSAAVDPAAVKTGEPVETVVPASEALPAPLAAPPHGRGVRVDITPKGPCWVSAVADERSVVHRLFESGDEAVVTARDELVLTVGDPQTFDYRLNGVPGRRLGAAGEPVTVRITADNYRAFVADAGDIRDAAEDRTPGSPVVAASDN